MPFCADGAKRQVGTMSIKGDELIWPDNVFLNYLKAPNLIEVEIPVSIFKQNSKVVHLDDLLLGSYPKLYFRIWINLPENGESNYRVMHHAHIIQKEPSKTLWSSRSIVLEKSQVAKLMEYKDLSMSSKDFLELISWDLKRDWLTKISKTELCSTPAKLRDNEIVNWPSSVYLVAIRANSLFVGDQGELLEVCFRNTLFALGLKPRWALIHLGHNVLGYCN